MLVACTFYSYLLNSHTHSFSISFFHRCPVFTLDDFSSCVCVFFFWSKSGKLWFYPVIQQNVCILCISRSVTLDLRHKSIAFRWCIRIAKIIRQLAMGNEYKRNTHTYQPWYQADSLASHLKLSFIHVVAAVQEKKRERA